MTTSQIFTEGIKAAGLSGSFELKLLTQHTNTKLLHK